MTRFIVGLIAALALATTNAGELRPFTRDSFAAIQERFAGRPFILTLWSLTCHHCAKELRLLGKLGRGGRKLPLALVSTDTPADADDIALALRRFGLAEHDVWVFADPVPERVRYAIDPSWHGELPRSYLFDAAHQPTAYSGLLDEKTLRAWQQRNAVGR